MFEGLEANECLVTWGVTSLHWYYVPLYYSMARWGVQRQPNKPTKRWMSGCTTRTCPRMLPLASQWTCHLLRNMIAGPSGRMVLILKRLTWVNMTYPEFRAFLSLQCTTGWALITLKSLPHSGKRGQTTSNYPEPWRAKSNERSV